MMIPSGPVRVMLAIKPVDFRKGADGLAALVKEEMKADPFCGVIYVFRAKRADRLKLVFGTALAWCWCPSGSMTANLNGPRSLTT